MLAAPEKVSPHGLVLGLRRLEERNGKACDFPESGGMFNSGSNL
jgi:hypothetical protein